MHAHAHMDPESRARRRQCETEHRKARTGKRPRRSNFTGLHKKDLTCPTSPAPASLALVAVAAASSLQGTNRSQLCLP